MAEQKFTDGILTWKDRRLDGVRRGADKAMGAAMGGTARSGLDKAVTSNQATADRTSNKPAVRRKAQTGADTAQKIQNVPGVQDRPTTVSNIAKNYSDQFSGILNNAADTGASSIDGTGWYFDHRRGAEAALPSGHGLASRQVAAMSAKLSAGKTPDDERESMAGIHELTTSHANAKVNGQPLSQMSGEQVASHASNEAAWSSHTARNSRSAAPSNPRPDTGGNTQASDALRRAGRAHQDNIGQSVDIARGTTAPHEAFTGSTPKTAAYGEMIAQSNPGSLVETDYRGVSQHMLDVRTGKQMPGQGMMQFSKPKADSPTAHALSSDSPTAIDTWMFAAGSGQPASAPNNDPSTGEQAGGRDIRVSKRMTDKNMPLDASTKTKGQMGIAGTPAAVTPVAAASAQHMEGVSRAAKSFGAVSSDQHGNDIGVPASLIQETVWTAHRQQAGADPVHNAGVRAQEASGKEATKRDKANTKAQGKLF
jgi:hypothetical protein